MLSYAFTTCDIPLGKPDRRKQLVGMNREVLPKGTRISVRSLDAEKHFGIGGKQFAGMKLVELRCDGFSGSGWFTVLVDEKDNFVKRSITVHGIGETIYRNLKEDTSLDAVLETKFTYADPLEILKYLIAGDPAMEKRVMEAAKIVSDIGDLLENNC